MQKFRVIPFLFSTVLFFALILTACGQTTGFTQDQAATAAAATVAAMLPSATPVPLIVTATPASALPTATITSAAATAVTSSTPLPTATAIPQTRINFAQGATFGNVTGVLQSGTSSIYLLNVAKGQPLLLNLGDPNNDLYFSVTGRDGTALLPASSKLSSWQTEVPSTQDYFIQIFAGTATENFDLSVEIPSRVSFAKRAISATVAGTTVNGYSVSYVLTAAKNQIMNVTLTVPANTAALTVYGYSDGQPYLRSVTGSTTFSMKLPSTQDYIIKVVPNGSIAVNYSMTIVIK
jgi:hypothetical protein